MAYTKQNWTTGDTITAAKLNHLENGVSNAGTLTVRGFSYIEGGVLVGTSDMTWQEIHDALSIGARVVAIVTDDTLVEQIRVDAALIRDGEYIVGFNGDEATTNSADGYPVMGRDDGGDVI